MADKDRTLILVRHSSPEFVTGMPAREWHLSAEGRRRSEALAGRLADYDLTVVVASEEPKAKETGQIIARLLDLPFETAPGLHEHERGVVQSVGSQEEFGMAVSHFFERPAERVLGFETADEAYLRFAAAVSSVVAKHCQGSVAIVSHGTVITLLISRANGIEPFRFWSSLTLPAFAVLSLPELRLQKTVGLV